jgi:hypothetical protein
MVFRASPGCASRPRAVLLDPFGVDAANVYQPNGHPNPNGPESQRPRISASPQCQRAPNLSEPPISAGNVTPMGFDIKARGREAHPGKMDDHLIDPQAF